MKKFKNSNKIFSNREMSFSESLSLISEFTGVPVFKKIQNKAIDIIQDFGNANNLTRFIK